MNAQPPPPRIFRAAGFGLILSFLLSALLPAAFAHATWPGRNGAIAFTRDAHIWVQLPSGVQRQLTSGAAADAEPTYSRDGRMIAFVRYDGSDADIWVMNSDGTDQRPVTHTDGPLMSEVQPAFYSNGRSLVFAQSNLPGGWTVFSIRLDGSGQQQLATRAKFPTISPAGRQLAFTRHPGGDRIRLKDLRSGEERQLPSGTSQEPDFSPDGKRLVFVGQRPCGSEQHLRLSVLAIGLNDRHERTLLSTCHAPFISYGPVWSPRGNRVLFTRRDNPMKAGDVRLQMLNLRGVLVSGAPRHHAGTFEGSPSWQPLQP
jgi:Tol biopolymer transport system component